MDYRADIQATRPCVRRAVVVDTEISPIPWQRIGQAECRGQELAGDTESFRVGSSLELGPGEPGAIDRGRYSTPIAAGKDRRIQDIDRFVIQTFKNRPSKVVTGIDDH